MQWTLVNEINQMDCGQKEIHEMDYSLKKLA